MTAKGFACGFCWRPLWCFGHPILKNGRLEEGDTQLILISLIDGPVVQ